MLAWAVLIPCNISCNILGYFQNANAVMPIRLANACNLDFIEDSIVLTVMEYHCSITVILMKQPCQLSPLTLYTGISGSAYVITLPATSRSTVPQQPYQLPSNSCCLATYLLPSNPYLFTQQPPSVTQQPTYITQQPLSVYLATPICYLATLICLPSNPYLLPSNPCTLPSNLSVYLATPICYLATPIRYLATSI